MIQDQNKEKISGSLKNEDTKVCNAEIKINIPKPFAEYVVDKYIMPFLFPNNYTRR